MTHTLPRRPRPFPRLLLWLLAVLTGLAVGCSSDRRNPVDPSPPPTGSARVVYAAIGASDAAGVGSSAPCLPFTECPNGRGYVPLIARRLADGREVSLTNIGVPGSVLGPAMQALARAVGRDIRSNFVENQAPFVPRDATLVTVFAGGNDTNVVSDAVRQGLAGGNVKGYIDQQVSAFRRDYEDLVRAIRNRAPQARIVVGNVPNMAALPYGTRYAFEDRRTLQAISTGFTRQAVNPMAAPGLVVVDLACDGRAYEPSRYSGDGFHPNDAGYEFLAEVFLRGILEGQGGLPASCAYMEVVPSL